MGEDAVRRRAGVHVSPSPIPSPSWPGSASSSSHPPRDHLAPITERRWLMHSAIFDVLNALRKDPRLVRGRSPAVADNVDLLGEFRDHGRSELKRGLPEWPRYRAADEKVLFPSATRCRSGIFRTSRSWTSSSTEALRGRCCRARAVRVHPDAVAVGIERHEGVAEIHLGRWLNDLQPVVHPCVVGGANRISGRRPRMQSRCRRARATGRGITSPRSQSPSTSRRRTGAASQRSVRLPPADNRAACCRTRRSPSDRSHRAARS